MTTTYQEIDWERSFVPLYGKAFIIPKNTILWRGYDVSYSAVTDRYSYYGSKKTAEGYAKHPNRKLGCFATTKPLRIIDYRFLKVLITRLIYTNHANKYVNTFAPLMISFGISSLGHQILTLKQRYRDILTATPESETTTLIKNSIAELESVYKPDSIIEQTGFRIAETFNDGYSMTFLQELFEGTIDGFMSPTLYSPFHIEKKGMMSPELIIFNPQSVNIIELPIPPTSTTMLTISQLINNAAGGSIVLTNTTQPDIKLEFIMLGDSRNNKDNNNNKRKYEFEELLNKGDKTAINIYKKAKKDGMKWKRKLFIYDIVPPHPCIPVSLFQTHLEIG
jgi:hypothetical protein